MPGTAKTLHDNFIVRYRVMVGDNIMPAENMNEVAAIVRTADTFGVEAIPRAVLRSGQSRPLDKYEKGKLTRLVRKAAA